MSRPDELFENVRNEASRVLIGNEDILEGLTIALLTRGHVLLEGVPGVAKTTIANLFAHTLGLEYRRIQMTPDLLPADVTGTRIYRDQTGDFDLQKGPIFSNVVVTDEINRATPKTQSALLEAMEEGQVTIEGETHDLPSPFILIATQNPIEMEGTFGLPEAQRDRFQSKLRVDIPERALETELLDAFSTGPIMESTDVESVVTRSDIMAARETVREVFVENSVRDYILDIVDATRDSADVAYGASPRAAIALLQASQGRAAIKGREYVIPDDPKSLAVKLLAHRLVLSTEAELSDMSPEAVIKEVLEQVSIPVDAAESDQSNVAGDDGEWFSENDGTGSSKETE